MTSSCRVGRFLTAIAATALNPLTIALWTVSFPAAAPSAPSAGDAAALLLGVSFGTLTWYGGFSTAVALARERLGDRLIRLVDIGAGLGLIGFGGVLGYRAVHER